MISDDELEYSSARTYLGIDLSQDSQNLPNRHHTKKSTACLV